MLHFKREGKEIRQGLNVYPLSDKSSFGFVILLGNTIFRMRYSKIAKRWFIRGYKAENLDICHHKLVPGISPVLWRCIECGHTYMEDKTT